MDGDKNLTLDLVSPSLELDFECVHVHLFQEAEAEVIVDFKERSDHGVGEFLEKKSGCHSPTFCLPIFDTASEHCGPYHNRFVRAQLTNNRFIGITPIERISTIEHRTIGVIS